MANPRVARTALAPGDSVWVPVAEVQTVRAGWAPTHEGALAKALIVSKVSASATGPGSRSWIVEVDGLTNNGVPEQIVVSGRRLRRHSKIVVIRIGDWTSERPLLDPLAASIHAQLSLMVPPGQVDVEYIRTLEELADALTYHGGGKGGIGRAAYGYVVLVGHGRAASGSTEAGIKFGNSWVTQATIAREIKKLAPQGAQFGNAIVASLCCSTGDPSFAKPFSDSLNTTFVGPRAALHAYEAAGFVHRLFFDHFMTGQSWSPACAATQRATKEFSTQFRFWKDGEETR